MFAYFTILQVLSLIFKYRASSDIVTSFVGEPTSVSIKKDTQNSDTNASSDSLGEITTNHMNETLGKIGFNLESHF